MYLFVIIKSGILSEGYGIRFWKNKKATLKQKETCCEEFLMADRTHLFHYWKTDHNFPELKLSCLSALCLLLFKAVPHGAVKPNLDIKNEGLKSFQTSCLKQVAVSMLRKLII